MKKVLKKFITLVILCTVLTASTSIPHEPDVPFPLADESKTSDSRPKQ